MTITELLAASRKVASGLLRLASHRRSENPFDQLGMTDPHFLGEDHEVAGLWIQAGQGVRFDEIRSAVVETEVDPCHVATTQGVVRLERRGLNRLHAARRE